MLCNDSGCSLCCILKTSFKTSLANPLGAYVPFHHSLSYNNNGVLLSTVSGPAFTHHLLQICMFLFKQHCLTECPETFLGIGLMAIRAVDKVV